MANAKINLRMAPPSGRPRTIYNLLNNRLVLTPSSEYKGLIKAYINAIYNRFLLGKIKDNPETRKAAPSIDTTFCHFENWLLERKNDKPYFAYLHVDDCHSPEIFYTYDTNDFNKLDEEFNLIKEYLKHIPKGYKGSMSYDISLRYADLCLQRLYDFLDEHKLLDDVNIIICADHGSSYSFDPYRSNYVNNVHRENYNMPFVVWNKEIKHQVVKDFYNTKDIPATILDLNNIKVPKEYDGMSILKNNGREYVLLENVCGGCPDYNLRDFMLGIRNNNFLVVMNLNAHKNFSNGEIISIYDLKTDKCELYNLKDTIDKKVIAKELAIIEKEFEALKTDIAKNNFLDVKR